MFLRTYSLLCLLQGGSGAYVGDDETAYSVRKDTKCMSVLLKKHPGHSENKVQKGPDGSHLKTDVPIPDTIYQYNRYLLMYVTLAILFTVDIIQFIFFVLYYAVEQSSTVLCH